MSISVAQTSVCVVHKLIAMLLLTVLSFVLSSAAFGQHHSHDARKNPPTASNSIEPIESTRAKKSGRIELPLASMEIPNSRLLDQNGKQVKFYSDLIKGKVVVVHFFFTRCAYLCPMQGRSLSQLKQRLAGRLGRDVFFISISKDPVNDTPEKLSKWGREYGVSSGWTLVTGEQEVIKKLLWDFTGDETGQGTHESMVIIGNDRTGVWTTTDGLLFPDDLVRVIDKVSRPAESTTSH